MSLLKFNAPLPYSYLKTLNKDEYNNLSSSDGYRWGDLGRSPFDVKFSELVNKNGGTPGMEQWKRRQQGVTPFFEFSVGDIIKHLSPHFPINFINSDKDSHWSIEECSEDQNGRERFISLLEPIKLKNPKYVPENENPRRSGWYRLWGDNGVCKQNNTNTFTEECHEHFIIDERHGGSFVPLFKLVCKQI